MWFLFTRALTLATSSTRVTIINTSTNFLLTAVLGYFIFRESLPPLWFLGAAMLVAGNVVIGRREEQEKGGNVQIGSQARDGAEVIGPEVRGKPKELRDKLERDVNMVD